MKKIIVILFAIFIAACGGGGSSQKNTYKGTCLLWCYSYGGQSTYHFKNVTLDTCETRKAELSKGYDSCDMRYIPPDAK